VPESGIREFLDINLHSDYYTDSDHPLSVGSNISGRECAIPSKYRPRLHVDKLDSWGV
jgi:hypothetical protein